MPVKKAKAASPVTGEETEVSTPDAPITEKPRSQKTKKISVGASKEDTTLGGDLKPGVIESVVVDLFSQGHSQSEIGMILADQYNIPKVKLTTGKTVGDILKSHSVATEIPEDLMALIRRVVTLDKHLAINKKDFTAKRGYQLTVSKIRRLVAYYHKKKRLPVDWRYSIEKARLLVK